MTPEATLARFRECMVESARSVNLLPYFELGIIDMLRKTPRMTAAKLGEAVGAKPDAVEQFLPLLVKVDFVAYDEASGAYSLDALAGLAEADLQRALAYMNMIKLVVLREVFYLTDSVRTGTLVDLDKLYGFDGNLCGAVAEHNGLRESWARLMDRVVLVYPENFKDSGNHNHRTPSPYRPSCARRRPYNQASSAVIR